MSKITIVVGAQWGDEGKGKWVDILAEHADYVARFQGGNNAGHTLYINGQKIVLHQVPSGILRPSLKTALLSGVVVDPFQLKDEITKLRDLGLEVSTRRFLLSAKAHVITPWHIYLDREQESGASEPIGTTKRGIGPTYAAKYSRTGLRVDSFISDDDRKRWLDSLLETSQAARSFYKDNQELFTRFEDSAAFIRQFVCDSESSLRQEIFKGKRLLLEGAQGTLLDINHGTYPFVTSSSTIAGGAIASLGFSPKLISNIYGIAKAYVTRVGEGPFPTELKDETGEKLRQCGNEFGATTGRPRRCGWLDILALRYAVQVNGLDGIILNKMDVLNDFPEIKIAIAYEHPRLGNIEEFPTSRRILEECKPVYQTCPGWECALPESGKIKDLPPKTKEYIRRVEEFVKCKVVMVGTGVNRENALF